MAPKKIQKGKKQEGELVKVESLKQLNLEAAGLDIGSEEIWAAVPEERDEKWVRCFGTYTADLNMLADWLEACGIETVAMESTSVYWIPIYEILEKRGMALYLVNAHHVKNVTGRKSDIEDCQWIQQLHTYGLLRGSFRPDEEVVVLRSYLRHRDNLIRHRSAHIQHMQKALDLMNVRLTNVISDITGVTGMKIIRAIVAGQQDPKTLAQFRDPNCKKSEEEIALALEGHYKEEHLYALKDALDLYDFYTKLLKNCDAQIEALYSTFEPKIDSEQFPLPSVPKPRGNCPDFDLRTYLYQMAGVDLTAIDGLNVITVQTILSEVGTDMTRWPTVKHFTSWLGLAPQNSISGGKLLRSTTKKVKNRAALAFRQAAMGVAKGKSHLGHYYRRMRAKSGPGVANVATAHKIARIFYVMLSTGQPYLPPDGAELEARNKQKAIASLARKAAKLGLEIVDPSALPLEGVS